MIVQVLKSCVKDITDEFQRGLDQIKNEVNVEVVELQNKLKSCTNEITILKQKNTDLREKLAIISQEKLNRLFVYVHACGRLQGSKSKPNSLKVGKKVWFFF